MYFPNAIHTFQQGKSSMKRCVRPDAAPSYYQLLVIFRADDHEDKVCLEKDQSHRSIQRYRMRQTLS